MSLEKRAATLRTLLTQGASEYKPLKAAERVRNARIQVLRATIGAIPSVLRGPQQSRRIAKLAGQIESLRATSPMAILAEFQLSQQKASDEA
jgi:hypothetical protein